MFSHLRSFVPHCRTILEYPMQSVGLISQTLAALALLPGKDWPTWPDPGPNCMGLVFESPHDIILLENLASTQRKVMEKRSSTA